MNDNRKRNFHIDSNASTDQVFMLLDAVQSDNEGEIDKLMNDFDTEFIAAEEIELNMNALTLEANVHVADQGTTHTSKLGTNKKRKITRRKYPDYMETQCFSTLSRELSP